MQAAASGCDTRRHGRDGRQPRPFPKIANTTIAFFPLSVCHCSHPRCSCTVAGDHLTPVAPASLKSCSFFCMEGAVVFFSLVHASLSFFGHTLVFDSWVKDMMDVDAFSIPCLVSFPTEGPQQAAITTVYFAGHSPMSGAHEGQEDIACLLRQVSVLPNASFFSCNHATHCSSFLL